MGTDLARFERFFLTFEGGFMMIPPLVGLDLDAISRRLPYLIVVGCPVSNINLAPAF